MEFFCVLFKFNIDMNDISLHLFINTAKKISVELFAVDSILCLCCHGKEISEILQESCLLLLP